MADPSAFFQRPRHPPVQAAAPPQLKAGATAAFSVAAWRQEALEFQQQLDGLLLETPPQQQAAIGSGADASLTPGSAGGQPPLLDASDLHLPTLQEEMIRQLVTEHGQQQQQQQQQGEPPGAAPLVPAASMQPPLLLPIPWDQPIVSPAEAGPALPFPLADAAGAAACATGSVGDALQQQQQQQQEEQGQVQAAPVPAQQEDEGAASQPQPAEPLAPSQQQSSPPAGRAGNAVTQLASAEQRQQQGELEQQQQAPAAAQAPSQQEQQGQPPPPAGRDEQESVPRGEAAAHPGGSAAGGPQRSTRSRMRGGSSSPPAEPSPPAASLQQPQQPQAQLPNPSSAEAAGPPYTSAPVGLGWDVGALLGMLGPQHPLLLWPELSELLALPPLLPPGLQPQQADAAAGSGDSGGGGGPRRERKRSRVEEGLERKPEVAAVLESYRQRAEAARQRRRHQHQAAARLLASIADSGLEAPMSWKVLQDARSRQLQLVATAAAEAAEAGDGGAGDRLDGSEAVLHVALHVPHAPHLVSEEWLVLESQPLTELRDRLFCVADKNAEAMEREENAKRAVGEVPLRISRPSAYFYVEGTFYNDLRQPDAADYSEPIRREHGIQAPPHPLPNSGRVDVQTTGRQPAPGMVPAGHTAARMEASRFGDLWLRLGSGAANLYCHQGGCEHLLTFMDVRLFDAACDPPLRRHYPFRITPPQHLVMRDCEVCGGRVAKRITYDDRAAPHTPFFCLSNKLLGRALSAVLCCRGAATHTDFRVFPYTCEYPPGVIHKGAGAGAPVG
ncbi:hypothetical protein CHLNCDRAFT_133386 [Chlorella variabilis]|uniref:snRNA-activating protein complex subunit 3 n=1 Tax=Chlorella variabilis TaxID=554065 RepID=E1Z2Z8_CHLVA|nr:hypothetical protein CHLNCDRAFT_133386 [Chlorella variabilis]EFN60081.1 hypothetical protein CHLNCDRAFT_133386 [Chlorella variabilis]|eukprot:XP_005852183.1 hypothetical protein CHLNCDRAFT_133386 [Chlorella variabilis]